MSSPTSTGECKDSLLSSIDSEALDVLERAADIWVPRGGLVVEDAEAVVVARKSDYGWVMLSALRRPPNGAQEGVTAYEWIGANFGVLSSGKALTFGGQAEFVEDGDGARRVTWGIPTLHDGIGPTREDHRVLSRFLDLDATVLEEGKGAIPPELRFVVGDIVEARPFKDPALQVAAGMALGRVLEYSGR